MIDKIKRNCMKRKLKKKLNEKNLILYSSQCSCRSEVERRERVHVIYISCVIVVIFNYFSLLNVSNELIYKLTNR